MMRSKLKRSERLDDDWDANEQKIKDEDDHKRRERN